MTKVIPAASRLWYDRVKSCFQGIEMNRNQHGDQVTANCLVQEVVERHPQTIAIFVRHRLQCVGCLIAPYHTIADSAREYALPLELLLNDFNRAIAAG